VFDLLHGLYSSGSAVELHLFFVQLCILLNFVADCTSATNLLDVGVPKKFDIIIILIIISCSTLSPANPTMEKSPCNGILPFKLGFFLVQVHKRKRQFTADLYLIQTCNIFITVVIANYSLL